MVSEPQVFLMYEPLSNLDAKLRVYMRAELKRLQKELGITTIYVTHDQVEAMTMGVRVAILNLGALQQFGKASDIYFHPVNVFVAGFIGSPPTNFFDCTLVKEEHYVFDVSTFKYPVPEQYWEKAKDWASSLILGIRPQDVIVHTKATKKGLITAMLELVEPLGDRQVLDLRVGDYLVKALASPDFEAELGDELWLEFPSDKIFVFDKKTERNLIHEAFNL
jgi:multiple sugar transport system ATP-binding protein